MERPGAEREEARRGPSNLQLRLATAAVGLPLLLGLVWLGGWPFAIAAGLVAGMATVEFVHGFLIPSLPVRDGFRHGQVAIVAAGAVMLADEVEALPLVAAALGAALALAGLIPTNAFGPRKPLRVQGWALLYIAVLGSTIVLLRAEPEGREWVFLLLLVAFSVDTGAYATGRAVGRHKMAPAISPGKTWEGAVGGLALGAIAVVVLALVFGVDVSGAWLAVLAALLPPVAIAGDLFESWIKRRMGIKDASGLLPGHGGFLDRLDSVLPAGAVLFLVVRFAL